MHSYETLSVNPTISCICRNFKVWLFIYFFIYIVIDPAISEFSFIKTEHCKHVDEFTSCQWGAKYKYFKFK